MNTIIENDRDQLLQTAGSLAVRPHILKDLDQHLQENGFAGAADIPQLIFLGSISRIFDDPVSFVIKGESGSGKSYALRSGLNYIPKSAYTEVNGMSSKAIVHAGKNHSFKHKVLVIQEAAGFGKEGWVFLRQLLTEKVIRYMTVAQTKNGHEGRDLPTVEGPISLMMTTTMNHLHNEDETRLLSLYVDQSRSQIRRAIMAYGEAPPKATNELTVAQFHALYEYVCSGPTDVHIPYKKHLLKLLPDTFPRVLRDIPKVIGLINAHALLHQRLREKKGEAIQADLEDYAAVYRLLDKPLAIGLQSSVPAHILEVVEAVIEACKFKERPVSQVEVADYLNRDQSGVSRNLATAVREGFIQNSNPGQGKVHQYQPGERSIPSGRVLPTPEEVASAFSGASEWVEELPGDYIVRSLQEPYTEEGASRYNHLLDERLQS